MVELVEVFRRLKNKSCNETDYYYFYILTAIEAFQYEAESGSIKPLKWMLELLSKMDEHVKGWDGRYIIFVFVGLTFYNFARDLNYRYAISGEEAEDSFKIYDRFSSIVKKYQLLNTEVPIKDGKHLVYFVDAIYNALVMGNSSICHHEKKRLSTLREKYTDLLAIQQTYQVPDIIMGLHFHHHGKLQCLNGSIQEAWHSFEVAIDHLCSWKDCKASTVSYLYDVLFGK